MRVLVVAFHTPGPYAEEATRLRCSLEELAAPHRIVCVKMPDASDTWKAAVCHKPTFILHQLMDLPAEYDGLVYTDADSILRRPMPLEELSGCDVAWHRFRWSPGHALDWLTGTMYFARDARVRSFVDAWAKETPRWRQTDMPEQRALAVTFPIWSDRLVYRDFGPEWCSIFDAPHKAPHRPVFLHMQASRRLRK